MTSDQELGPSLAVDSFFLLTQNDALPSSTANRVAIESHCPLPPCSEAEGVLGSSSGVG